MPRTKITRTAASKRPRNQVVEEAQSASLRELDKKNESMQMETSLVQEMSIDKLNNAIQDIRGQLTPSFLRMTIYELMHAPITNASNVTMADLTTLTNNLTAGYSHISASTRGRGGDEGYLTEESGHSSILSTARTGRPLGPLASAKAKSRRSRSAQKPTTKPLCNIRTNNTTTTSTRQSRQMYRTPAVGNRLQTMSCERGMQAVTPKMQPNVPVSMLRYQRMGETVISMDGSPVIAQGIPGDGANINIPVENGVISVLPSAMSSVEPGFLSQLKPETLQQLKMLQANLNLMMRQCVD